jgi:hypothetical protein
VSFLIARNIPSESEPPAPPADIVLSDDEFPPHGKKFISKAPAELVDSDSDMDDELFSGMNSLPFNSTPPATTLAVSAPDDDVFGSDIELSDGDGSDTDTTGPGTRRSRRTRAGPMTVASNASASTSRIGRTRRNAGPDPTFDFDEPVRLYSKSRKPAKKTLFSLGSLLKEKERKERIGYDIQIIKKQVDLEGEVNPVG